MTKLPPPRARGPFARPLRVQEVPARGLDRHIEATPEECAAAAVETGLQAMASLVADLRVEPRAGGRYRITGQVTGIVTQVCVVSLDPFDETLRQPVDITFADETARGQAARARTATVDMDEAEDPPDPIQDHTIDLGAVALEFLTLARDPYPRKPGVRFAEVVAGETDEPQPSSFAALRRLKDPP